jgi:hypothetical protein
MPAVEVKKLKLHKNNNEIVKKNLNNFAFKSVTDGALDELRTN